MKSPSAAEAAACRTPERPPEYRYHLLRAALAADLPGLHGLEDAQLARIERQANKTFELESLVLGSPEAAEAAIPSERLDQAMAELRGLLRELL